MPLLILLLLLFAPLAIADTVSDAEFRMASFSADVTPPIGHVLFTGHWKDSTGVDSPLEARGFVLLPPKGEKAVVFCSVDWSEIRNEAYDRWRDVLAEAASTTRERVLVSAVHQHDTPLADLEAERLLNAAGSPYHVIDLSFHEAAVQRVAESLRAALHSAQRVTHLGFGLGKVEKLASNRRYHLPDGTISYNRMSATKDPVGRAGEEGLIDPFVRALSFWDGDKALVVLSVYSIHPMSYYGTTLASSDFPGIARNARQATAPATFQIYASGCSGNTVAGKYNDGDPENRPILAQRLESGMKEAFDKTRRVPLKSMELRLEKVRLDPRTDPEFTPEALREVIKKEGTARSHGMAAIGLSWAERAADPNVRIDFPAIRFNDGEATLLLLPGEIYVEYQLAAQSFAKDSFVITVGYGESAAGYISPEKAREENDGNLQSWSWVAPNMEERIMAAIQRLVQ